METNYVGSVGYSVAESSPEVRAAFIRKTYAHLALAILAFIGLEAGLIVSGIGDVVAQTMLGGRWSWLIVLGAFIGVSSLANWWANSDTSKPMQYLGLGLYVVAFSIISLPMLYIATKMAGPSVIASAGILTFMLFLSLSLIVLLSRKDFSFLGPILAIGGFGALGFIIVSTIFGFSLGNVFSFVMVLFAAGSILYNTSNVLHVYRPNQHVAASLSLFASIALLFWYILRIFMSSRN
jgi:FtsH-binding integral membrane protein